MYVPLYLELTVSTVFIRRSARENFPPGSPSLNRLLQCQPQVRWLLTYRVTTCRGICSWVQITGYEKAYAAVGSRAPLCEGVDEVRTRMTKRGRTVLDQIGHDRWWRDDGTSRACLLPGPSRQD